jgi:hypothetical protein
MRDGTSVSGERLGRGDADLGSRQGWQYDIGFARDRALRHVDHRDYVLAQLVAVAQRRQGIGGLARLADEQRHTALRQGRLAVAELRGDVDFDRDAGHPLEPILGDPAGVARGTAGDHGDARHRRQIERQRRQADLARGGVDEALQGVADHGGLLEDLLLHEVAVVALADQRARQFGLAHLALGFVAALVEDRRAGARHHRPVALFQIADLLGQRRQSQGVGAEKHLAVAVADRQRAAAPRAHHHVVFTGKNDRQREGALEPAQGRRDGLRGRRPTVELAGDQRGDRLGVGIAFEVVAGVSQFGAQALKIFDDAVVHHRDPVGRVGMGVGFVGHPVGRPAGVADADIAGQRVGVELGRQISQLALGAAAFDAAVDQGRHAGGIVAAIFQPLEPVEQLRRHVARTQDTDDAAHGRSAPSLLGFGGLVALAE